MARPLEVVRHCCLAGTNLERADLRYMDLRGVNFTNSNLRGADLSHADCRGTIFVKADLSRACLYNTNCEDALAGVPLQYELRGCGLQQRRPHYVLLAGNQLHPCHDVVGVS